MTFFSRRRVPASSLVLRRLEDRVLFDAAMEMAAEEMDMEAAASSFDAPTSSFAEDSTLVYPDLSGGIQEVVCYAAFDTRRELLIIDTQVSNYQQLVDDLMQSQSGSRELEIVFLDADRNGIDQITELLSTRNDLDAIHLISHGEDGAIRIGNSWLTSESLTGYAGDVANWGASLSIGGDVLIYGCEVAQSSEGQGFVNSLSALMSADIAVSADDTGAAEQGGDWDLEYHVGEIESNVAFSTQLQSEYQSIFAVGPTATISGDQEVQIGENFNFTVTFDNAGSTTGYGPFVDLIFPVNGIDGLAGTGTADGIDFVSASYLGHSLNVVELIFPDDGGGTGTVDHPFAFDSAGNPLQVTGVAGDKLVVVELPFGSVTSAQPEIAINIRASVSNLADLGSDLIIQTRSGFRYGQDALDNPTTDPSVVSDLGTNVTNPAIAAENWTEQIAITPTLMSVGKTYVGPEDETATGPNFVHQYVVAVDIADGQTITALDIIDSLPDNIVVTSVDSVLVNGASAASTNNLGSLTTPGTNQELIVSLTNAVTGTSSDTDVLVTFSFYVAEFDASAARVIPVNGEDDGASSVSVNNVRAVGDWTPIDTRDTGGTNNAVSDPAGDEHVLDDKAIAIQKSVAVVTDTGSVGATPGDTLEYTLTFQISDYYTFGDLVILDTFQDGQTFDFAYGATFDITDFNGNVTGTFTVHEVANVDGTTTLVVDQTQIDTADDGSEDGTTPDGSDGSTTLTFDVSRVLQDSGAADGVLQGGLSIDGNDSINRGAATGTIRFRTVIQEDYTDSFLSGDRSVDQGDVITNSSLQITGTVRQNAEANGLTGDITQVIGNEEDTSAASILIESGTLTKEVYAINGNTTLPMGQNGLPVLVAGDVVTYRIRYVVPTSDFEQLRISDYLPLPIFSADDHNADGIGGDTWTFNVGGSFDATAPASGVIEFGAGDTFYNSDGPNSNIVPTITVNSSNGVELYFGDYDDPTSGGDTIELYLSVTAQDAPTADGLFLTNIVRVEEGTTQQTPNVIDRIIQIEVTQPELNIQKGVISTNAAGATFSGATGPTGITFAAAGTVGSPFSGGVIHSDRLAVTGIDANLTGGIDAGDIVRYAIVIENTGNSSRGAFDVQLKDLLPTGMSYVSGSLQVVDGTGAAVAFSDVNGGNPGLFGDGIELSDPGATPATADGTNAGAIDGYNATSGRNVIIVFYDAVAGTIVAPDATLVNTVTLANYAGREGGEDHTPTDLTDDASVTTKNVAATKSIVTTSEALTTFESGIERVTIGEIVRYRISVELPEGSITNMQIRDVLPAGLTFIDDGTATLAFVSDSGTITSSTQSGAGLASTSSSVVPTYQLTDSAISISASVNNDNYQTGSDVYFKLGDVTNAESDANAEYVIVEFNALVDNNSISAANRNDAGELLYNDVYVYTGGTLLYDLPNGNRPVLSVVEPLITNVNKTADVTMGDAGDTVTYTITFTPTSNVDNSDAFDVRLLDTIPGKMTFGSITSVTVGGVAATPTNNSAGNTIDLTFARVNEGQTVSITYTATINASVNPNEVLTNTASVTYSSLPGALGTGANATGSSLASLSGVNTNNGAGETGSTIYSPTSGSFRGERNGSGGTTGNPNDYADTDPHSVTIDGVTSVTKTLISTEFVDAFNGASDVVIGELVTYEIVVTFPEGTIPSAQVVDTLDSGLAYVGMVSSSVNDLSFSGSLTPTVTGDGRIVTWNLGSVSDTNLSNDTDGTVTLRYQAVVLNVAGNQTSTALDNSATFTWGGNPATAVTVDAADVTVVEPVIAINTGITVNGNVGQANGDAGDTIRYTITLANSGPVDAFDLGFSDALPTLSGGSSAITGATFSLNDSAGLLTASDFELLGSNATGYTLSLKSGVDFDMLKSQTGRVVTLIVDGTVASGVFPNQSFSNTPVVTWTSMNGDVVSRSAATTADDGERDGTNASDTTHDYVANDPVAFTVNPPIFTKTLFGTDRIETSGSNVTVGENVTYALLVRMPEGTAAGLTVVDQLPDGLNYGNYSIVTSAAASGGLLVSDYNGTFTAPTVSGGVADGDDVTFTFGSITTTVDNVADNNAFLILVTAAVSDVSGNVGYGSGQTTLANNATLDVSGDGAGPITSNTVNTSVVESNLAITKNIVAALANAGDTMTIALSVTNSGLGNAYDVVIEDTLLAAQYDLTSIATGTSGSEYPSDFTASYTPGTGLLRYSGGTIGVGQTVTFTFAAKLTDTVATDAVLVNTATIENATSLSGTVAGERDSTDPDGDGSDTSSDSVRIREHSLAGFVYFDADNDGVFDSGETGIQNVSIRLQGTDHLNQAVDTTIQTLANGSYLFADLRPGTYSITQTQPTVAVSGKDYLDGRDTIGTPGGNATANDTFTSIVLPLNSEVDGTANNFGELEEAEISGFVYHDADNDGVKDLGEATIGGVVVTLTGTDDLGAIASQTFTTLADGAYSFDGLRPGTYTLTQTQPTGNAPSGRAYIDGRDTDGSLANGDTSANNVISSVELVAADTAVSYNFGEVVESTVSGYVYHDTDNDGERTGEVGLGGVTITLTGTDDLGNVVNRTTTTSAVSGSEGYYEFANLRPSNGSGYRISETTPTGYLDGKDKIGTQGGTLGNDRVDSVIVSDTNGTENNFGELLASSLAGIVFNDKNNDGLFNGTDELLNGVSIRLTGVDDVGNAVDVTTTTSSGAYSFDNLRPSNATGYTITETQPTSFNDGIHSDGSLANGDVTTSNVISSINVNQDVDGTQYNFAERGIGIGGTVFVDDSRDGVLQAGESTRISGVTVQLWNSAGTVLLESQTTGADGSYLFVNRPAGDYRIVQLQPSLYTTTSANTLDVTLPLTGLSGQNFGEALWDIGDQVWFDADGDGNFDADEPGLGNVSVSLIYAGSNGVFGDFDDVTSTTTTAADGTYTFAERFNGNYRVVVGDGTLPIGLTGTSETDDTLAAIDGTSHLTVLDGDRLEIDFGYAGTGRIGDTVWLDTNGEGQRRSGEPGLANISVNLEFAGFDNTFGTADDFLMTRTTDANGVYSFGRLPAGSYRVAVDGADTDLPADVVAIGGVDARLGVSSVTLSDGGLNLDQDFAFTGTLSIGDTVFVDHLGDGGAMNPGEGDRGISGVTVTLDIDFDGNGTFDHQLTTVTDANGAYSFDHLIAGDYRVNVDNSMLGNSIVTTSTYERDGVTDNQTLVTLPVGTSATDVDFGYPGQVDYAVTNESSLTKAARGGDTFTYTVTATNVGQRDGTGVFVTDTLPIGILDPASIISDDPSNTIWNPITGELTWNIGDLDYGDSQTLVITVSVFKIVADPLADTIATTAVVADDGANGLESRYDNNVASTLDPLTTFAFDSFNDLSQGPFQSARDDGFYGNGPAGLTRDRMLRPIPVDPIFSGLAEPGTTLSLRIYDENGRIMGERQVVADAGGNWMANFPGTVIWKHPHKMEIEQTASIQNDVKDAGFNLRRYFHPATHHSLFMTERPSVAAVMRELPSETIEAMHQAHVNPLSVGVRAHLYQLNVASTNAASK
ncbi:Serine-aspartate repeat-containing protein D precursor [Rubripirellula tenax]|uniref:Serine-aspartate repeat-containing protein D n=1 Tax=Rubripirellula tenax TaxID=2528015 RepID=A0A5C6FF07_9BACT|nr:SdrD B-like domain-containing protein [Rubripirellula tenax]TWU59988.1 Serine-aspartate repeat-containing protein D precursor [Rubripirellula tenax]